MTLSTHVLDLGSGAPAPALAVTLYRCNGEAREQIARARTGGDGRIPAPFGGDLPPGEYELVFSAGEYFARNGTRAFYGSVPVRFFLEGEQHYHVPLLLSPWGYSTYRGS